MRLCFVFPGQGSQYVGMGKDLYDYFDAVREFFKTASEIVGYDVARLCFEGSKEDLDKTEFTQPCLLTVSAAIAELLRSEGIYPNVVAGHSLGEYSALVAAGSISFEDAVRIVSIRGKLMAKAVPPNKGSMAAILGLDREKVKAACDGATGYVAPANYNCPGQIVISGEKEAVEEASKRALYLGAMKVVQLAVSVPSHCLMMKEMADEFASHIETLEIKPPKAEFVNNADAMFLKDVAQIRESLVRQLYSPVLWEDSVLAISKKADTFVEVGPGKVLTGLIKRIVKDARLFNVNDTQTLRDFVSNLSC